MARCLVRGSMNCDEYYTVADIVRPGQTIHSTSYERHPGGRGANQAVAIARAGGVVSIIGSVGKDGGWIVQLIGEAGVDVSRVVERDELPTGRAIVQLSRTGENAIVLHGGANLAMMPPPPPSTFDGFTHLLLQNEISLPSTLAYLAVGHGRRITTVFNPSPMLSETELLSFPWSKVDWLIVNASEATDLLRALGTPSAGLASAALGAPPNVQGSPSILTAYSVIARLNQHSYFSPTTRIICTLGPFGVLALDPSLSGPLYVPAIDLRGEVQDTTGAGDCFAGYFVAGLMALHDSKQPLNAEELQKILATSVKAAGMSVERRGAMESVPTLSEIKAQ